MNKKNLSGITECQAVLDPYQARCFIMPDLGPTVIINGYNQMTIPCKKFIGALNEAT